MRKFYNDIQGYRYDGRGEVVSVDCIGCATVTLLNTSLAGAIILLPSNTELQPQQSVTFTAKEWENNLGKIQFQLTNFFANIEYGYALIMKKFI